MTLMISHSKDKNWDLKKWDLVLKLIILKMNIWFLGLKGRFSRLSIRHNKEDNE